MTRQNVLVIWPIRPEQMEELEQTYQLHRLDLADDPEGLIQSIADRVTAVVTSHGGGFPEALLQRLPNLQIVASSGIGTDTLCVDACNRLGIPVAHTPDVLTDDVADMAMMLLLATVRRLLPGVRWIERGNWKRDGMVPLNRSISKMSLGIVGLGRIGKAIARRAEVFGMDVHYYSRTRQESVHYAYYSDLVELADKVDVLVVAVPGGKDTEQLVGREVLAALGSAGYLINVSRGSVIHEGVLIDCLQGGVIAGAGLDVFENEPYVPDALQALDNVVLQPHCASGTVETRGAMAQLVVDNLTAHFSGKPLLTPVQ